MTRKIDTEIEGQQYVIEYTDWTPREWLDMDDNEPKELYRFFDDKIKSLKVDGHEAKALELPNPHFWAVAREMQNAGMLGNGLAG